MMEDKTEMVVLPMQDFKAMCHTDEVNQLHTCYQLSSSSLDDSRQEYFVKELKKMLFPKRGEYRLILTDEMIGVVCGMHGTDLSLTLSIPLDEFAKINVDKLEIKDFKISILDMDYIQLDAVLKLKNNAECKVEYRQKLEKYEVA